MLKNDITDFSVHVACTNTRPVAGILLHSLESEVLETIHLLRDLSKRGYVPFEPTSVVELSEAECGPVRLTVVCRADKKAIQMPK